MERPIAYDKLARAPGYRETGVAPYRDLGSAGFSGHRVVGLARLGNYRLVKRLVEGPGRILVLQLRWGHEAGRWQVRQAEVARSGGI